MNLISTERLFAGRYGLEKPQLGDVVVLKGKKYKIVAREYNFDESVLKVKMDEYEH